MNKAELNKAEMITRPLIILPLLPPLRAGINQRTGAKITIIFQL